MFDENFIGTMNFFSPNIAIAKVVDLISLLYMFSTMVQGFLSVLLFL